MNKINNFIFNIITTISLIGSILSIISFMGQVNRNAIYIIVSIVLLVLFFSLIIYKIKYMNYNYTALPLKVILLPSLIDKLRATSRNNITANIITFSYSILENNKLEITIDIDGINKYDGKYSIGILNTNTDTAIDIKLLIDKNILKPVKTENSNKYVLYTFKLPYLLTNFKITISQDISKHHSNLYFYPRNYIKSANIIKIRSDNDYIKCFKIGSRSLRTASNIPTIDGYAKMTSKDINSIFLIENCTSL